MHNTVEQDAREFGAHVRQGGWRLGLLVARNVERGKAGRPPGNRRDHDDSKVSASAFAKASGTSTDRVLRYLDAWDKASKVGVVAPADELLPGQDIDLDVEALEDRGVYWGNYYDASQAGGYNGKKERLTAKAASKVVSDLPAAEAAEVVQNTLRRPDVIEHLADDPDAAEDVLHRPADRIFNKRDEKGGIDRRKRVKQPEVPKYGGTLGGMMRDLTLMGFFAEAEEFAREHALEEVAIEYARDLIDALLNHSGEEFHARMTADMDQLLARIEEEKQKEAR